MINLQNPSIPPPTMAIEIDKAIYELQMKLDLNLDWLTNTYGRAYRHLEKKDKRLYFPEVYIGGSKKSYHRVTPDNDMKGSCFFVVGKENNDDFDNFVYNYLKWDVGIVFWVNLKKINEQLLESEHFRQLLIRDARDILTRKLGGLSFNLKIKEVVTEFNQIYKEFTLREEEEYLRAPYSGFRFNCELVTQEDCGNLTYDPVAALLQNISPAELQLLIPTIDFSIQENFDALTNEQKTELLSKLQP